MRLSVSRLVTVSAFLLALACRHTPENHGNVPGLTTTPRAPASADATWNDYGGVRTADRMGEKYSGLDQINVNNVKKMKKIWVYNTGEKGIPGPKSLEVTPVYHNGKLYGCSIFNKIFALDADSGKEVWSFDPKVRKSDKVWAYKCRGVALWTDPARAGQTCGTRVISSTIDGRVVALDAENGQRCADFVDRGPDGQPVAGAAPGEVAAWVNVMSPYVEADRVPYITKQKDHPWRDEYYITSAPLIFKDLVIIGGGIADNGRVDATSGAVQAFDVRTGELKWSWDPAPAGLKAAGQPLTYGTPNVWAPIAADDSRGLIFLPTGAAAPDYYAANRNGKDQYANSVIALRVEEDGRMLDQPRIEWQFKAVIQDKWDYDMASQPVLTDLQIDGRAVPVVIQATKMGFVFIMNRETGQPVYPTMNGFFQGTYKDLLQEVPVKGVVPEEKLIASKDAFRTEGRGGRVMYSLAKDAGSHSKYQPFPPVEWQLHGTPKLKSDLLGDLAGFKVPFLNIPISKACREMTEKYDYEGMYTPPTLTGGINFPGAVGGVDWGGVTIDPVNQILFVNQIRIATIAQMHPRAEYDKILASAGAHGPKAFKEAYFDMLGTPYGLHRFPYIDPKSKLPCSDPPYGILKAVSLKNGQVLWQKVFGDFALMSKHVAVEAAKAQNAQSGEIAAADKTVVSTSMEYIKQKAMGGVAKVHGLSAGVPNFGGSLATKGGLLFIAAAADSKFRVYNLNTGKLLHDVDLSQFPGAGSGAATPMTFVSNRKRQIVVVASGGNKFIPGKQGDAIVAFAVEE